MVAELTPGPPPGTGLWDVVVALIRAAVPTLVRWLLGMFRRKPQPEEASVAAADSPAEAMRRLDFGAVSGRAFVFVGEHQRAEFRSTLRALNRSSCELVLDFVRAEIEVDSSSRFDVAPPQIIRVPVAGRKDVVFNGEVSAMGREWVEERDRGHAAARLPNTLHFALILHARDPDLLGCKTVRIAFPLEVCRYA